MKDERRGWQQTGCLPSTSIMHIPIIFRHAMYFIFKDFTILFIFFFILLANSSHQHYKFLSADFLPSAHLDFSSVSTSMTIGNSKCCSPISLSLLIKTSHPARRHSLNTHVHFFQQQQSSQNKKEKQTTGQTPQKGGN